MIVCVCHGVSERRVEALAQAGADCPDKMERACGAGGDCGACRADIEEIIARTRLVPPPTLPEAFQVQAQRRDAR